MNIQKAIKDLKDLDSKILLLMKKGITISFIFCLFSTYILYVSNISNDSKIFYIGISLLKSSLFFIVGFVICGVAFNTIKKEL